MTLTQLLVILRARWRSALVTMLAVLVLVALATVLMPKKYTATASVVLDVKSPDPIAGVVLPGMTVSSYMGTQVDVVQSERVLLKAVRELGLDQDAELRAAWTEQTEGQGDFAVWLTGGLAKNLDVKPSKESNVISVQYTSKNPDMAARVANAVVKGYIDTTVELRAEPARQFNSFFDESTRAARESLEKAQTKLSDFQKRKGIIATDERMDVENARLAELSSQMVALQGELNESSGREDQAARRPDQMTEVMNSPLVVGLSQELARLEARQRELNERLGERNPQVIELKASIEETRSRLALEKSRAMGGVAVNNNVNKGRLEKLRASLEAQRNKVLTMKSVRDEANVLLRDVENAQKVYDAAFAKMNQSALESQATQTNVSVLKSATRPIDPSSPRNALNAGVGLLLGVLIGAGTAVLRERRDWKLRTPTDVTDLLAQPLLGTLLDATPMRGLRANQQLALPGGDTRRIATNRRFGPLLPALRREGST